MNIKIEKIPAYRIAYIRQIGPYGIENVQTMEKLKEWAKSNHLFNDESIILGIARDNPETTKPENCRYDTCIVVSNDYSFTDGYVRGGNIVGGKSAVFKINHTAEAVQKAWIDIFPELSRRGYQFDEARPIIERYVVNMVNNHHCEICVPIK
jgi:DNA gyrase inhibitor GyrI